MGKNKTKELTMKAFVILPVKLEIKEDLKKENIIVNLPKKYDFSQEYGKKEFASIKFFNSKDEINNVEDKKIVLLLPEKIKPFVEI